MNKKFDFFSLSGYFFGVEVIDKTGCWSWLFVDG